MAKLSQKALELFQAGNLQGALAQLRVQNIFLSSHLLAWGAPVRAADAEGKGAAAVPPAGGSNAAFLQHD